MRKSMRDLFHIFSFPPFRKERAINETLHQLPRCSTNILVAGFAYGDSHYRGDVVVRAGRLLEWIEGDESQSWRSSLYEESARAALPIWLRAADMKNMSVTTVIQPLRNALRDCIPYFVSSEIASVYCPDCDELYAQIRIDKLNKHDAGAYSYWTDEWKCPHGHTLYRKDQQIHYLQYDTEETVRMPEAQTIKVHVLDPRGNYSTTWRIGKDVSAEIAQQAEDPQSNALYAMVTLEDGKVSTHVLKKQLWLTAKEQFDSIDQRGAEAMAQTRKDYPQLFEQTNDPGRNSNASRAPIGRILPSFVPIILERGLPGYASETLTVGEIRIPMQQLRPLLVAAALIGAWDYAGSQGFDSDAVRELLIQSISAIPGLMPHEAGIIADFVSRFLSFNIIRSEHSLDDWLCEAMWPAFQAAPYRHPSAMSNVLSYALDIRDALRKTTLEY